MGQEHNMNEHQRKAALEGMLSQNEQAEVTGKAIAGHIWDSMEEILGGPGSIRAGIVADAWADAHAHFQGEDVRANPENDDSPFVVIPIGDNAHGRTSIGSPNMDVFHNHDPEYAIDTMYIDKEDRLNPAAIKRRAAGWLKDVGPDYGLS
jgi:hypothetical protein